MGDYAAFQTLIKDVRAIMAQLDRIEEQNKVFLTIVSHMNPDPKRWAIPMGCIQDANITDDE